MYIITYIVIFVNIYVHNNVHFYSRMYEKVEFFNHNEKGLIFRPKNNTIHMINVCLLTKHFRTDYGEKK